MLRRWSPIARMRWGGRARSGKPTACADDPNVRRTRGLSAVIRGIRGLYVGLRGAGRL